MSKKRTRVAAYLRRSDKGQEASIKDQRAAVTEYAERHDLVIVEWYIDDGISGDATEKRHAFLRMRDDAASGNFTAVLCWDQDRFGRFDSLDAGYWIYPFKQKGVSLITVNEGEINWNDFTGRMMYSMKQEGKHQFLHDLSRNVTRGQVEAAKAGSWLGKYPYGYRLEGERKNKRLVVVPEQAKIVSRIFKEYVEQKWSMTAIAKGLTADGIPTALGKKRWHFESVKVILSNPAYIGTYRWNVYSLSKYNGYHNGQITSGARRGRNDKADWVVKMNNHDAIVNIIAFKKAQDILAKGKTGRAPYTAEDNPYLLSGKLRCGHCGGPMHGFPKGKYRYYKCTKSKREKTCEGTTVREDVILQVLADYVEREFIEPDHQVELLAKAKKGTLTVDDVPKTFAKLKRMFLGKSKQQDDPKRLEKQIVALDANINKARGNLLLLDPEDIPDAKRRIRDWEEERQELALKQGLRPRDEDINKMVLSVLGKLFWLGTGKPQYVKPVVRELDHIKCHTTISGKHKRKRHKFIKGEVHFGAVGTVTGKLNPHAPD